MAVWPSLASQAADQGVHLSCSTWFSIGVAIIANMPAYLWFALLVLRMSVLFLSIGRWRRCNLASADELQPPMKLSRVTRVAAGGKSF
jgi:hypothetical protein